jgi:hypothetical protein
MDLPTAGINGTCTVQFMNTVSVQQSVGHINIRTTQTAVRARPNSLTRVSQVTVAPEISIRSIYTLSVFRTKCWGKYLELSKS